MGNYAGKPDSKYTEPVVKRDTEIEDFVSAITMCSITEVYKAVQNISTHRCTGVRCGTMKMDILSYAIEKKVSIKVFRLLVRKCSIIDQGDKYGQTALFYAVCSDNIEYVKCLVENGARVNHLSDIKYEHFGNTPICYAKSIEMVKYLLSKGSCICSETLLRFIRRNEVEIVECLVKYMPKFGSEGSEMIDVHYGSSFIQNICLHWDDNEKSENICRELIKLGENIKNVNKKGTTPLEYAIMFDMNRIVKLLLDEGAYEEDTNKSDDKSPTPFQQALLCKNIKAIEIFFDYDKNKDWTKGIDNKELVEAINEKCIYKIKKIIDSS